MTDPTLTPHAALIAEARAVAEQLRTLAPQMHEDARIHETWTTEAARRDVGQAVAGKTLGDWVGDVEWHRKWAAFYRDCAVALERSSSLLPQLAAALEQAERAGSSDTQRLDWLEQNGEALERRHVSGRQTNGADADVEWWSVLNNEAGEFGEGDTARAAIDAAIQGAAHE